MATFTHPTEPNRGELPIVALDLPVMYEDEGQEELGETDLHYQSIAILHYGLKAHLKDQAELAQLRARGVPPEGQT